jgi:hypothetical protein
MIIYISRFFLESGAFRTKVVDRNQTHSCCLETFIPKSAVCEIMWKNMLGSVRSQMTIYYGASALRAR